MFLFRVVLRRQGGSIGLPDLMLVVLVSECVSPALSAETQSVPNGLAAVLALLFWNFALDRLAARWPWLQRILEPSPLQLVREGEPIRKNMDAEGITDEELMAQLRENGIDDMAKVKAAFIESEGTISVIPKENGQAGPGPTPVCPDSSPDIDKTVARFMAVAAELQATVAWHEKQAADHKTAAKAVRELLAHHGVRTQRSFPLTNLRPLPERT